MSEPTGGWTDTWPRWGIQALAMFPFVCSVLMIVGGTIWTVSGVQQAGICVATVGVILGPMVAWGISDAGYGYVTPEWANRHEIQANRREQRRQERRAKRLCKERGIPRLFFGGYADEGYWAPWTETLSRFEPKEADVTPQELFVKGDIDMDELERRIAHER